MCRKRLDFGIVLFLVKVFERQQKPKIHSFKKMIEGRKKRKEEKEQRSVVGCKKEKSQWQIENP